MSRIVVHKERTMSLHQLVKPALLAFALSLLLVAPTARADDEPSDPSALVLKTYDLRDLGVTNEQLTGLRNDDGSPWKPNHVSVTGGILVVSGSAAEHEVLHRWIAARRKGASLNALGADAAAVRQLFHPDVENEARRHIDRLASQAKALERQQAELGRIDQTTAELAAKREALIVHATWIESALAEKRYDDLRLHLAQLGQLERWQEVSRSSLRTDSDFHELTSYAGRRNSAAVPGSKGELGMLDELRSLRAEVRELKALVLKLVEQDGGAVDPRGPR